MRAGEPGVPPSDRIRGYPAAAMRADRAIRPADGFEVRASGFVVHDSPALLADRGERMIVDLAARDHGDHFVEEIHESPEDARLPLASETEQDEVMPGEQRVLDRGDDRLLVADDAREERLAVLHPPDQVLPHLLLHEHEQEND
jgi:hypothetical protein